MLSLTFRRLFAPLAACLLLASSARVWSAPSLRIVPPEGSAFAVGQRFDLRVEASDLPDGSGDLVVLLNGKPIERVTTRRVTRTATKVGSREVTVRGLSMDRPMTAAIVAQVRTPDQTLHATSRFRVLEVRGNAKRARNVILLIGDGMGMAQRTAARIVSRGIVAGRYRGVLEMEDMEASGYAFTPSLNSLVTDSANGATVYAGGNKAENGALCVWPNDTSDPFDNPAFENLCSYLKRTRGMAIGVVTTSALADATPAAFLAHSSDRGKAQEIVGQFPAAAPDLLLGGGRSAFRPKSEGGSRTDGRDIVAELGRSGLEYVTTSEALRRAAGYSKRCLGLFDDGAMPSYVDRMQGRRSGTGGAALQPTLPEMTDAAIAILSRHKNGFFLMVEGASIDKNAHSGDAARAVWETIEFDRAVGVAKRFAARNIETLVVVVADHETGGMAIRGVQGNPPALELGWGSAASGTGVSSMSLGDGPPLNEPIPPAAKPTGISTSHTAGDVPVSASGPGARQFRGPMDATEVFIRMLRAVCGGYRP